MTFFQQIARDTKTYARTGLLSFENENGSISVETPVFMPVGTRASVKGLWQEQLTEIGYRLILGNTYHLYLRPGEIIEKMGGLKSFMSWDHAVLTDSGGFQVFSLSENVRFHENGVEFRSHIDGSKHFFSPEAVIDIQRGFRSDIMMVLDDCPPADGHAERIRLSLERTHRWAAEALDMFLQKRDQDLANGRSRQNLFGIVQGAIDEQAREESLDVIQSMHSNGSGFDGIAIGGLSVGESREDFYRILHHLGGKMDESRPRYLMGVGTIPDFLEAVACGIDMFDCVLPTRNARNGQAITSEGKINLRNKKYALDRLPVDSLCNCVVCSNYSRGYIRHLFTTGEMLGPELLSYHNLAFYQNFFVEMRKYIRNDDFYSFYKKWKKIEL